MANETEINQLTSEVAGLKTAAHAILDNAGGAAAANAEAAAAAKQAAEDANAEAQTVATAFGGVSTLDTIRDQTIAAAARTYDTLAALLADTAVYPVDTYLSVRGGGTYKQVASGGDFSNAGKFYEVASSSPLLTDFAGAITDRSGDPSTWDWGQAASAASAWLLRNGGGRIVVPEGVYRHASPIVVGVENVPQEWVCHGAVFRPDAGVEAIVQSQARAGNAGVIVRGATVDGQFGAGTVGCVIRDHASAVLTETVIKSCDTGVLITCENDWSESSHLDAVYIRDCQKGIHFENVSGTGSCGYFSWGQVHVDYIGGSGSWADPVGVIIGVGTNIWVSDISNLVLHVSGPTATAIRVSGDISRQTRWRGVVEGFTHASMSNRYGIHLTSDANAFSAAWEFFPLGHWSDVVFNEAVGGNAQFLLRERGVGHVLTDVTHPHTDVYLDGEAFPRLRLRPDRVSLGSGASNPDTHLVRAAANVLASAGQLAFHNTSGRRATFDISATGDRTFTFGNSSGRVPAVSAGAPNQTYGLLFASAGAGAPTGTPADVPTGCVAMYVDTTNSRFYVNIGGVWKSVALT